MSFDCYVFFDVDDTLVRWNVSWEEAFVRVAGEAGVERTYGEVTEALEWAFAELYEEQLRQHPAEAGLREFWRGYDGAILARLGVKEDLPRHTDRVIDLLSQPESIALFPETEEALRELVEAGVKLGIVTERPEARPDLERLGIGHYFDPVIDAFAARGLKRGGVMFALAARAAEEAGAPAWHVGDRYHNDVLGARAAGLRPILVDRQKAHLDPDCPRVSDLREIASILANGVGE